MARRSGLGKGLGSLLPAEVTGEQGSVLRQVPISWIRPNRLQPRSHFDEESMSALAASIGELGVLQPVLVRPIEEEQLGGAEAPRTDGGFEDRAQAYELIAGERRWRAARRAGLQTIPVLVRGETDDLHSLEQALVENLHRDDLNVLEEAAAYQQLIDEFGFTHEQVAVRVGKSRTAVTNTLRLLQLPAGVQRALAEGSISAGHARALLGTPDRGLQEDMVQRIIRQGLTVRAVEEEIRLSQIEAPEEDREETGISGGTTESSTAVHGPKSRRLPEPGVLELEELLATHLNTRVKVELHNHRGRVVVEFATLEDLERIYRSMVGETLSAEGGVHG